MADITHQEIIEKLDNIEKRMATKDDLVKLADHVIAARSDIKRLESKIDTNRRG